MLFYGSMVSFICYIVYYCCLLYIRSPLARLQLLVPACKIAKRPAKRTLKTVLKKSSEQLELFSYKEANCFCLLFYFLQRSQSKKIWSLLAPHKLLPLEPFLQNVSQIGFSSTKTKLLHKRSWS